MHNHHNRTINILKADLIKKIEENKVNHIKDYEEAVIAYKEKAAEKIKQMTKKLKEGSLSIGFELTTPVNRVTEYDKVIKMFEWETKDNVELTQAEFNEYVHDENSAAISSRFANSLYKKSL